MAAALGYTAGMFAALSDINWLSVLAARVVHFLLAGAWFAGLFARQYAAALGISDRPQAKPAPRFLIGPFLCSAVTIAATALLLRALAITTLGPGLMLGAVVGVGYLVPMTVNIAINPLFPRPFHYALINAPLFLLGSLVATGVLVALS